MEMTHGENFIHEVRVLQRRTRCSNVVCDEFVKTFRKYSREPVESSIRRYDKEAKNAAGCNYSILHGCPKCNRHVYKPTDKDTSCPFTKADGTICNHPRFDDKGNAFEVFVCYCFAASWVFCFSNLHA